MNLKRALGCVAILTAFCLISRTAQADCDALIAAFNSALAERSLDQVRETEASIAIDPVCGGRLVEVQRKRAALQLQIAGPIQKGSVTAEQEKLVADADKPDVLWRAAVALGDLRFVQRKFVEATAAYERALEDIKNLSKTPTSPGQDVIKAIFARATEAKMLAANEEPGGTATYVAAAKDHRDGTLGGTMSADIRGFRPTTIPIPIGFETASTRFTPVGEKAANELLQAIRQQDAGELTLVGHTDERGQADYNMRLSADRAKAVADFLKQNGVTARITTIAKGKSEPLQLPDAVGLTREDLWALNRRVVWVRR